LNPELPKLSLPKLFDSSGFFFSSNDLSANEGELKPELPNPEELNPELLNAEELPNSKLWSNWSLSLNFTIL
jgi:hypothetical protein